ncbi:MAG: hypothetical protein M1838_000359 [Thelocarpon superellum]|nr:MAG: hypothetical protein M1838_000359 [Thelocarpon superellum]
MEALISINRDCAKKTTTIWKAERDLSLVKDSLAHMRRYSAYAQLGNAPLDNMAHTLSLERAHQAGLCAGRTHYATEGRRLTCETGLSALEAVAQATSWLEGWRETTLPYGQDVEADKEIDLTYIVATIEGSQLPATSLPDSAAASSRVASRPTQSSSRSGQAASRRDSQLAPHKGEAAR